MKNFSVLIAHYHKYNYFTKSCGNIFFYKTKLVFYKYGIEFRICKSIEIKSSTTINSDFFKGLTFYKKLNDRSTAYLIYGGNENKLQKEAQILSWNNTKQLTEE